MPTPTAQAPLSKLKSALGTNLNGISYWSTELPFVNVMKSSSVWISGDSSTWDNKKPLDLDSNGWVRSLAPGQLARTLMLYGINGHYPGGQYFARWQGSGNLRWIVNGNSTFTSPGTNQVTLQVTPDDFGIELDITATNPTDYIRNIEIIMPGGLCYGDPFTYVTSADQCGGGNFLSFVNNPSIVFNPVFLNSIRNYSVLRFMDWLNTNNSPVMNWSQRTPVSYQTYSVPSGVPVEVMIALANLVGAHPWFNMPHQTDDTYAQSFAQLVAQQLDPSLKVYVEDSNEVWNSQFGQYTYEVNQSAAQTPAIDNMQYHALRTRTIGQTFKNVVGASRVVAALGAQAANPWTASHGLDYLKSRFGAAAVGIDTVAIAPYFSIFASPANMTAYVIGSAPPVNLTTMTLTDFFSYVRTTELPEPAAWMVNYRALANTYGVHLIAYEGGQSMVGIWGGENIFNSDPGGNPLFDTFNRDPRIKQMYLDYLASWKQAGGELFVHYHDAGRYGKWGRWGALEYIDQPRAAAPKFDAIQTFIEQNPVWWTQ